MLTNNLSSEIFNAISEGILLLDDELAILDTNSAADNLLSWAYPLKGKNLNDIFFSQELNMAALGIIKDGVRRKLQILSYHGHTGNAAFTMGKGREKNYKIRLTRIEDGYILLTLTDATRMERLATVRQDFVANVSHELKTPLTAIIGFSETLSEENLSTDEMHRFADIILNNSKRMQRTIQDLLLLTSLDRAEMLPSMEKVSIRKLLNDVEATTEFMANEKNILVSYSASDEMLLCNESLIFQALINLVINAINYSPSDSCISVTAVEKDNNIVFSVTDQGCGIAEEDLARIFERFYRVDKARSRASGGTGLGLSIVRHIAILHEGTIQVDSELKKGSVFKLSIPKS